MLGETKNLCFKKEKNYQNDGPCEISWELNHLRPLPYFKNKENVLKIDKNTQNLLPRVFVYKIQQFFR